MVLPVMSEDANLDPAGVAVNEMCVRHGFAGRAAGLGKPPAGQYCLLC